MSAPCPNCISLRAERDELRDAIIRITEAMEVRGKDTREVLADVIVRCQAAGSLLVAQMLRPGER